MTGTISTTVDLVDLVLDDTINARRTRSDEGIGELKASIRAHGVGQSLRVRPAGDGKYKIVAGSRRYRVLCELAVDGDSAAGVVVNDSFQVPVLIGDDDDDAARELSLAENFVRLPQHDADTYQTFRDLADRGLGEAQIAGRFGIEPKVVKRILALGRLSPLILDAWRAGELDERGRAFDTVRAFTLAPSVTEQERVFKKLVKDRNLHAHAVRVAFGGGNHEAAVHIKIAGLEAYKAAGGKVTRDLFGDEHIIADKDIAREVAEAKVKAVLEGLAAEGWSWVSMSDDLPYSWTYSWGTEKPAEGKATAGEKKQIKKLEKAAAKGTDGAAEELATLHQTIAGRQWTPEQLAKAGAVVSISHHGDLNIKRGVVKPQAAKKATSDGGEKEKAAPTITNAMTHRLSLRATNAARQALSEEPRLGLAALLAGFLGGLHNGPVKVTTNGLGGGVPYDQQESFSDAFGRLAAMSDADLFKVAAGIAGRSLDLQCHNAGNLPFGGAASLLAARIDPARMTSALQDAFDAADYFGGVSKPFVIDAIRDAINDDEARKAEKLKKKELVEFAVANVPGTGWLPLELRAPTYSGPGAVPVIAAPPLDAADPDFSAIEEDEAA